MRYSSYLYYYSIPMFFYGFGRSYRGEHPNYILFSSRVCMSTCNGILYSSPLGIIKLLNIIDRFTLDRKKENPGPYSKLCYEELFSVVNKNIIL